MPETPPDRTVLETQEAVRSILGEKDLWNWDSAYIEVGQSYSGRRLERAFHLTRSRKVPLIASAITTIVATVIAGVTWESLQRGLIAGGLTLFVALLATVLFYYLIDAPKELHDDLHGDLEAAKKQLTEEKRKLLRGATLIDHYYRSHQAALVALNEQYAQERGDLEKLLRDSQSQLTDARAHIEKLYRKYRERHLSQMKEISDLKRQIFEEKSKHAVPNIDGRIKEAYFKDRNDGLYITLRVFVNNTGSATTLQPFVLRFLYQGKEYIAQEEDDVTDYCIHTRVDKPLWPSFEKEESYEPLKSLSEENLTPLERNRFREGWLRFRILKLVAYMRGTGGELTLEVIDATDKIQPLKLSSPWPQTGTIRLTKQLRAEWDEAIERSRQGQEEEAKEGEESAKKTDK